MVSIEEQIEISTWPQVTYWANYIPLKATKGSVGMDLKSMEDYNIIPQGEVKIDLGIRFVLPKTHYMQLCLRSGIKGLLIPNGFGIIDSDYRGRVFLKVFNYTNYPIRIKAGDRVAQAIFVENPKINLFQYDSDEESFKEIYATERGEGGFGSTGR
jgi:dUTP pyrophosphatase